MAPRGEGKSSEDRAAYRRGGGDDKKAEVGPGGGAVEFVSYKKRIELIIHMLNTLCLYIFLQRGGFGRGGGPRGAPPPSE